MAAAKLKMNNLTAILDNNRYQQTGPVSEVMPSLTPIDQKWLAFDWAVFQIDGHDMHQVLEAFRQAREVQDKPQIIIAHTDKGRFLSPFTKDKQARKHGVALKPEEAQIALKELDQQHMLSQDGR